MPSLQVGLGFIVNTALGIATGTENIAVEVQVPLVTLNVIRNEPLLVGITLSLVVLPNVPVYVPPLMDQVYVAPALVG